MSGQQTIQGVTPTKIRKARPASLCSVFIRTICSTPSGDQAFGKAIGFHYRSADGVIWLITNWHVLTGRRPDKPGMLLENTPQSPYKIEVVYPGPAVGQFLPPLTLGLYQDGKPIWRQYRLDLGNDVAGIPINLPEGAIAPCIQDFAQRDEAALQPGMDVTVIGFPFEQGEDMPFPIWKRAMVASEPGYTVFGNTQTLLDTPGTPGMSGSPVYRLSPGLELTGDQHAKFSAMERGEIGALDALASLDIGSLGAGVVLNWIGVYAGSTGVPGMDRLSLGRMMLASIVDLVAMHGEPGENPFPPQPVGDKDVA